MLISDRSYLRILYLMYTEMNLRIFFRRKEVPDLVLVTPQNTPDIRLGPYLIYFGTMKQDSVRDWSTEKVENYKKQTKHSEAQIESVYYVTPFKTKKSCPEQTKCYNPYVSYGASSHFFKWNSLPNSIRASQIIPPIYMTNRREFFYHSFK